MRKFTWLLSVVLLFPLLLAAQTRVIKGKVLDEAGQPLAGVSIIPAGSKTGTQTDKDGAFSISVKGDPVLLFSFVGYKAQTVNTVGVETLTITMEPAATSGDEVVVIGYATVKRKDLTASVSSVGAKQLKDIPINSAAQALAGRLAGVQITGTEGTPNAEVLIRVRGGGSITQDNSPLYIIDGVQVENALNVISPQDIETVDVLKDASATAIYGARGANGVVIITTKGGKNQKTTISYNGLFGFNKVANKLKVMNPYEFVTYQWERSRGNATDSSNFARQYGTTWDTLQNFKNVPFIDWQDIMFGRRALFQTHNVSMVGGNASTTYNLSLTSNREQGVMLLSDFDRKLVNFKLDHNVNSKLKVGFNTRYNNTIVNGAGTSTPGSSATNRLRHSVKFRPLLLPGQNLDDFDADYNNQTNANSLGLVNPILLNEAEYRRNYLDVINLSGFVDYKLKNYLTFRTTIGYDININRQTAFDDTITGNARLNGGGNPMASISTTKRTILNNSNVLTFNNAKLKGDFHKKNRIIVIAGQEIFISQTNTQNILGRDFPVGIDARKALANMNLGTPFLDNSRPPTFETENRIASFFGRVNYDYDGRILTAFSLRADGSTKFAEGRQWGYFPSGSVAWRVSNEKFFSGLRNTINDLKFRVSYGEAGNNRIGDFLFLTQFNSGTQYWLNNQLVGGFAPEALANENLKWETTISRNIGLDLGFLSNKLQLSVDLYQNTTRDLLVDVPIPTTSGWVTQIQNVGSTENRGIEFQLNADVINRRNFSWTINFNASSNRNRVTSLGTFQNFYLRNSGWGFSNTPADFIIRVGSPVGSMWGYVTDGFYQISDFIYNAQTGTYTLRPEVPSNASVMQPPQPGTIKFKDLNGDGVVNDLDRTVVGVAQPKWFGGLNQMFSYKNFDMSIFINYQFGNDVYNANKLEFTTGYQTNANMLSIMNNRWRRVDENGVVVTDPEALAKLNANATLWQPSTSSNSFVLHSWAVEDGSFVRINNVTLGYTIPAKAFGNLKIQKARAYFTVNNLAVFTRYSGYDPEVSTRRRTPETPGVDYSAYPRSRSFILGLNFSF
jgi:TonB-linked SusC/RagA family outer membrane protein